MTPAPVKRSSELAADFGVGVPLATLVVWLLDTYVMPAPMPGHIAAAVGALVMRLPAKIAGLFNRRM